MTMGNQPAQRQPNSRSPMGIEAISNRALQRPLFSVSQNYADPRFAIKSSMRLSPTTKQMQNQQSPNAC